LIEANSIKTKDMEAEDANITRGIFTGIEADGMKISGASSFSGDIDSGVLKVLPSKPTPCTLANATSSAAINTFMAKVRDDLGYPSNIARFTIYPTSGTYNAHYNDPLVAIRSIEFIIKVPPAAPQFVVYLITGAGVVLRTESPGVNNQRTLTFTVGTSARTLRLEELPTSTNVDNEVYRMKDNVSGLTYLMLKE
jgi:hypothetical protein